MSQEKRPLRIWTPTSCFEGELAVGAGMRTLDHLNAVSNSFITIEGPKAIHDRGPLESSALVLNKSSILLLQELAPAPSQPGKAVHRLVQKAVLIRIGPFVLRGFLHVPSGMPAMKRLDQAHHPFLAVTAVFLEGPGGEATAPFLALNRLKIDAAQLVGQPEPAVAGSAATGASSSD